MSNELKDIVDALDYYGNKKWQVIKADREGPGLWTVTVYREEEIEEEPQEATNDND